MKADLKKEARDCQVAIAAKRGRATAKDASVTCRRESRTEFRGSRRARSHLARPGAHRSRLDG